MIILTAGHTGAHTGAQCTITQFDEGAENIWLRNRIAEILTNKYNLIVLIDNDHASLQLLTKALTQVGTHGSCVLSVNRPNEKLKPIPISADTIEITLHSRDAACCVRSPQSSKNNVTSVEIQRALLTKSNSESLNPTQRSLSLWRENVDDFVIDIHFNAHPNPQARGTEAIVSDDATTLELRFASRLAHVTAEALEIPLRCIKSESQTPHRRLAMLHLTPQSIILEICFCTSPEDVAQYRKHQEQLANALAHHIAELLQTHL